MEPSQTDHGAALPQQGLTQPAGGCPFGLRPDDLELRGCEGANPHTGQRDEVTDRAATSTPHPLVVTANTQRGPTYDDGNDTVPGPSNCKILNRLSVFNLLKGKKHDLSLNERANLVISLLGEDYEPSFYGEQLLIEITRLMSTCESLLNKCKRNRPFFLKKHSVYLNQTFITGHRRHEQRLMSTCESLTVQNVPPDYVDLSERHQRRLRRRLETVLNDEPQQKVLKAFPNTVKVAADGSKLPPKSVKDLETVINLCLQTSTKSSEILRKIHQTPRAYTPDEALAVVIDRKFTVDTYEFLRADLKERGCFMFPSYYLVKNARKACYPSEIQVSEREASVSLQSLLQHTLERIVKSLDDNFCQYCEQNAVTQIDCIFLASWGFDGSTGQSLYKQKISDSEGGDENSIVATTLVPLQVSVISKTDVIWNNNTSQSYRYCRPIHVQYRKENSALILSEKQQVENQIQHLEPLTAYTTKGYEIKATCKLYLAAIDGKVLNAILSTPSQLRCPYCDLTATHFNNLDEAYAKPIKEDVALCHGMSPLHAWIRVLEFLLKLGYKNEIKKWRVPAKSEDGRLVEERKKYIQAKVRDQMGLLVDVVKPNAGTTNDGNTARMVLSEGNREKFANILNIENWLLDDLHTILIVLSSGLPVDDVKFGTFCKTLAYKYVACYGWHPMTVTMHKILVHGANIIKSTDLPIGMLSEQAAESRNKFWRFDREHHCRKKDRMSTMLDLFHRALESSDPLISNIRLHNRQNKLRKLPLPPEALALLKPADAGSSSTEVFAPKNTEESRIDAINQALDECPGLEEDGIFLSAEESVYFDKM